MCKLKKRHVILQNFFPVNGHFELHRGENFWSQRQRGLAFTFGLYFLVRLILNLESITRGSESCISQKDKDINLSESELAFLFCQFQSCLANALEGGPDKFRSLVGSNPNFVHVLSTLFSFDNWVQVLTYETLKSTHRSAETLGISSVGRGSASKIECKHFCWPLVQHLQTVIRLTKIEFADEKLPSRVLCSVTQGANWMIVIGIIIGNQTVSILEVHQKT